MNAADHFLKAEDLARDAEAAKLGSPEERLCLELGQLHATLALAATGLRSLASAQDET